MAIDKELAKQILAADKPRHFLFVTGATNQLKLSRGAPSGDDEKQAKQAAGGSPKVFKGRTLLEKVNDEQTLVFFLKAPDKALEPKLKRAIKEHAGLGRAVEVRALAEFKAEEDDAQPQDGPPQDGQPQAVDPFKAPYEEALAALKDDFIALKKVNPDLAAKLEGKMSDAVQSVAGGTGYKDAAKALRKIQELSDKGLGKVTKDQKAVAEKAAYKSLRDRLAGDVQKLRVLNPALADKLNGFILEAEGHVADNLADDKKDYKSATKTLLKLETFVAKGLAQTTAPTGKQAKKELNEAQQAPKEYETAYRESRNILKNLTKAYPQSQRLKNYQERLAVGAGMARTYRFDQALPAVKAVHQEITGLAEEYRQYVKKRESLDQVLNGVYTAKQPEFAPARIQHFRDYRNNVEQFAQELQFDTTAKGMVALEEEARLALSERQTYLEAYRETAKLLHEAEGKFDDEKFEDWEASFLNAGEMFETGSGTASQAYDVITSVGAEIRKAQRTVDVKKDSGQRVTDMTEGDSREARRLRYKLELDGVRKSLLVIANHDPETAAKLGAALAKVTEAQKKSLTRAEKLFAPLLVDVKAAMAAVRQGMKKGDWDYPEDEAKAPKPLNLKEWGDDIEQNGVLGKVKVGKQLAKGGYGAIYILNPDDQHLGEDLPPLVVKLPLTNNKDDVKESLKDFQKEAGIYERIGDHPNILKCLGVRKVGDSEGLVMEAVRGKTTDKFFSDLRARVAEGELSEPEFWSTVQYTIGKTMSAIAHIHKAGLAHNDLKPQNIMIDEVTGDVKVIDVGTANLLGDVVEGVDNPIYQAPEQLKKEGSSGQTDALPVGGVAFEGVTGQGFHFGDKQGMMSSFLSNIEDTMKAFAELRGEDAEEKAIGLAPEDEVVRKVNRRGEDDPEGDVLLRDPSKSSARSAFTEFMNGIMHPDPTKRLSPQQALEHPFLRDAMMSEDQVRAVIQSSSKDKAVPGEEPERDLLNKVFVGDHPQLENWEQNLAALKETVKIDPTTVAPEKLLAARQSAAEQLEALDAHRLQMQRAVDVLTGLIANARQKDTELYFSDNRNLDTAKKMAKELDQLRPDVLRIVRTLNVSISRSTEAVGDEVTPAQVAERIKSLQLTRATLSRDVDAMINNPAPALFDHCRHLERLQEQVETMQANTAIERQYLFKLSQRKPAPPELKNVAQQLTEHLKQLAPLVADVRKAREDASRRADDLANQIASQMVPEYESLKKTFGDEDAAHKKLAKEYQAVVKAPRDTPEAMIAFEKARNDFEAAEDQYQTRLAELRQTLADQQAKVIKQQQALGKKSVEGVTNPLKTLSKLYKDLNKLKAKMVV